jgi:hypothetical protein
MRCKYEASEKEFIDIMKFFSKFKIQENTKSPLQIVRIKNRLDAKDNDILINFFFMNRIQCELQLSIFSKVNNK